MKAEQRAVRDVTAGGRMFPPQPSSMDCLRVRHMGHRQMVSDAVAAEAGQRDWHQGHPHRLAAGLRPRLDHSRRSRAPHLSWAPVLSGCRRSPSGRRQLPGH